jgi:hypothetical protein
MAEYSAPEQANHREGRKSGDAAMGFDPVSPARFGEIINSDQRDAVGGQRAAFDMKRAQLNRATWVMIVVAGVVLGIAMAMMAAG